MGRQTRENVHLYRSSVFCRVDTEIIFLYLYWYCCGAGDTVDCTIPIEYRHKQDEETRLTCLTTCIIL